MHRTTIEIDDDMVDFLDQAASFIGSKKLACHYAILALQRVLKDDPNFRKHVAAQKKVETSLDKITEKPRKK